MEGSFLIFARGSREGFLLLLGPKPALASAASGNLGSAKMPVA